ncbi:VENN motif pre-toxin domain-containing protein, partial [Rahnella sp. Larv3_ips]|uniref:VENN motif pre-toxin domain-containing protein n=1 Tax=Rahnella sp. Larv3_ips TaxID=1896943 RepID=UPI002738CBD9
EYASVGDQSGLFAGNQGYDIYVGDHTQLNGAVIASTADAANNSLNTGTLGWDDIQNKANYIASSVGVSAGFSSSKDQGDVRHNTGGVLPVMTNASGSASGTTRSAVADGSITVRDTGQQTQEVSTLSRDTENANGHIDKIFDKQKIEENQAVAQAISQVGVQTMQNVVMQAQVNARSDALARLSGTAEYNKASPADQQKMLENSPEYIAAEQKYGIGSPFWTAGTAISGALAPYLSLAVKAATTDSKGNVNEVENITGHALAGAVVAYLQGGSVSGGAVGAATGELAAQLIAKELYPGVKPENLTNDQKANVSALSTLAAGLAGGVAGNSSVATGTGAVAGKTAVENNAEGDLSEFEKDAEELRKKENEIFGALPDTENPELTHKVVSPGLGPGVGVGAKGSNGAQSTVNQGKLNSQLLAEEVANGHAYEKHVLERKEFSDLGISTKSQFQSFVEGIVTNPEIERRQSVDGTTYYLDNSTKTIVIRGQRGEATAFRPDKGGVGWDNYINSQVPKK